MPDLSFLADVQLDGDALVLDGEPITFVMGSTQRKLSTDEVAAAIFEACKRAARRCETCKQCDHWTTNDGLDRYACIRTVHSVIVASDHFCGFYEPATQEAPDA